jgi:predicted alpha/beta-hydrolase family hydrolase
MKTKRFKIHVSDSLGEVSAEIIEPEKPKVLMVLAHGAGAGMDHSFMVNLAHELAQHQIATLRFNLQYMERGKKRPDVPAVAHSVIKAVIEKANTMYPGLPLIIAGKSFGGRMSSQLIAKTPIPYVRGIVFYGFPLHPINIPGTERAAHLQEIKIPMLFLQGTKDALAEISLVKSVLTRIPLASLDIIENADHSFKVGKKDSIVDLSKKTENWLRSNDIL